MLRSRNQLLRARTPQRKLGAYYTSSDAAGAMARWVLANGARTVLEPSFGDGVFLRAVAAEGDARVYGAELNAAPFAAAVAAGLLRRDDAHGGDFLAWHPPPIDAVIGNPPYVRLRHLPAEQQARALEVAAAAIPGGMQSSGSVWMAFVLHAANALRVGGRMALVLPFELTHVRYARPLWGWLGGAFGALRVVRVRERLFPDLLQDVVVLFAADRGGTTAIVEFEALDTAEAFARAAPRDATAAPNGETVRVFIEALLAGERGFMEALLPGHVRDALAALVPLTVPVRELCSFNIGYVSADKVFFHPDAATCARFSLAASSLVPALTSSRQVQRLRTSTTASETELDRRLFMPLAAPNAELSSADAAYVAHGESLGVHQRYKCRTREPWFRVPDVRVPDVVLSVFSERPVLAINDAGYVATNSLLCGFLKGLQGGTATATADALVAAWYTSLTVLGLELQVHALGGGVMVVVPGEAGKVRVARVAAIPDGHIERLAAALAAGDVAGAYALGDDAILRGVLGVSAETVAAVQEGVRVLARWRDRREPAAL